MYFSQFLIRIFLLFINFIETVTIIININFIKKSPALPSKPSLSSKTTYFGFFFAWGILHHALLMIKIATTLVQLVIQKMVIIVYHLILIIRKFILTQVSTEIIVATQVMMIMHGASFMLFGVLWHYQVLISIFLSLIDFI